MREQDFKVICAEPYVYCKVFENNSGALELARLPKLCPRTTHINVCYHHFHSWVGHLLDPLLVVPEATYLDSGLPSQDYTQSASIFIKINQGDINVGAMFTTFVPALLKGMRLGFESSTRGQRGNMNTMNFGASALFILEGALLPIAHANLNPLSLNCVRVIGMPSTTIGNGTPSILISWGQGIMNLLALGDALAEGQGVG
jgi:hypothetical protein